MNHYEIKVTNRFKKQIKKLKLRGFNEVALAEVIELLSSNQKLPAKYRNHLLEPKKSGIWECHVQPDILLMYQKFDDILLLIFLNIGTHSELFR